MHLRFYAHALAALSATSLLSAQEGYTPPPRPSLRVPVVLPQDPIVGEAKTPLRTGPVEGESTAADAARPGYGSYTENLPIPDVRPVFNLAQQGLPGQKAGTERWLVTFYQRSFDLSEFRNAIYRKAPVEEVNEIVAGLERKMIADQAKFGAEIERLGGRISHQWWIINGCAVEVPRSALVLVAGMPNVATFEPDREFAPVLDPKVPAFPMILTATNASNHNADAVQAKGIRGHGVGIAIVDTGQDGNMGGTGSAHITYFRDGIKPGVNLLAANKQMGVQPAEDTHGHGTGVASVAGGAKWNNASADHGHAYNATKVGYSICDVAGSCNSNLSTQATAWNTIAADKATYKIVSANMSYGSSPSPTEASQQAADSCSFNADVFIATAAGNSGASTAGSPSNANGLSVAACNATTKTMATFSSRGPLSGDAARFYPDITGCGVNTIMAQRDNEATNYVASGTSMASPQVCGAAALVRTADTSLTALETKAILLCSTEDISAQNPAAPYNSRNAYGMGFLRDDLAVERTEYSTSVFSATITAASSPRTFLMPVTNGKAYSVALTWHRRNFTTTVWNNLDLRVLNGAAVVASSLTTRNLYEKVVFTAPITGNLTIEVAALGALSPATETFAICHNGEVAPDKECRILPVAMETVMGNSNNNIPFSWTPTRYQQVFVGSELPVAFNVKSLGLRQDEAFNGQGGHTVNLEIRLGYTSLTPATLTTTFASNYNSGAPTTVLPAVNVGLPNFPAYNNGSPEKFLVRIPFPTPFSYVPSPGRNVLIEVIQRGNSNGNAIFTYPLDAHSGAGVTTSRLYGVDTATTGTLGANYGLVMCFDGPEDCVIVPEARSDVMGNSNNSIPFSWNPTKYQQVFIGHELGAAAVMNSVGLRAASGFINNAGATVDLEIALGYTTYDHLTLTTNFATNQTSTPTTVVARRKIVLPNFPPVSNTNPKRFLVHIPFSTPFSWAPSSGRNLLIDVDQRGNSRGNAIFSYPLDASSGAGTTTTRLYAVPPAATGTLGVRYGLVMCFGNDAVGSSAGYRFYGTGCPGTGPATAMVILPSAQAAAMGNSNNAIPFSWTPTKYQQVFLGTEQPVARVYNGLGLRQDESSAALSSNGGIGVDLEMQLGYTTLTPATLGTTYATNFNSGAPVTVLPRQIVVMPNMPPVVNTTPAEFFIQIPFSAPFGYVPAAGRNTLIQVIQRGNTNGSSNFGYFLDAQSGAGTNTTRLYGLDTAVTGTLGLNYGVVMSFLHAGAGGAVPLLTNTGDPIIGNSFSVDVSQARPASLALLFHGVSNTAWGFVPLPFSLAGVGAPGCFLRASGEFIFATGTNAFGRGSISFTIPGDLALIGGPFYNQYAVSDAAANPLGFSWTRGGQGIMGDK